MVESICEFLPTKIEITLTKSQEINLRGLYLMSHYYIQSQRNPKEPTGTLITVSSGRAGLTSPGGSAYNVSKLAEQRLNEHIQLGEVSQPLLFEHILILSRVPNSSCIHYDAWNC